MGPTLGSDGTPTGRRHCGGNVFAPDLQSTSDVPSPERSPTPVEGRPSRLTYRHSLRTQDPSVSSISGAPGRSKGRVRTLRFTGVEDKDSQGRFRVTDVDPLPRSVEEEGENHRDLPFSVTTVDFRRGNPSDPDPRVYGPRRATTTGAHGGTEPTVPRPVGADVRKGGQEARGDTLRPPDRDRAFPPARTDYECTGEDPDRTEDPGEGTGTGAPGGPLPGTNPVCSGTPTREDPKTDPTTGGRGDPRPTHKWTPRTETGSNRKCRRWHSGPTLLHPPFRFRGGDPEGGAPLID